GWLPQCPKDKKPIFFMGGDIWMRTYKIKDSKPDFHHGARNWHKPRNRWVDSISLDHKEHLHYRFQGPKTAGPDDCFSAAWSLNCAHSRKELFNASCDPVSLYVKLLEHYYLTGAIETTKLGWGHRQACMGSIGIIDIQVWGFKAGQSIQMK